MFFQKELETMPRRELEALQLERLRHIVDYCDRNVQMCIRDRYIGFLTTVGGVFCWA